LDGISPGSSVYFVHSLSALPKKKEDCLADVDYNGRILSAVIKSGSLYGCQFDPEEKR